ncbi:MAG TPA: hypothetical protein PLI53_05125 [Geobacteraceae bacterium]|nr:hypothetical protein [Geobacteraceae bacterium]
MKRNVLTAVAISVAVAVTSFAAQQTPAVDGDKLLEQRCSVCHSSARAKKAQKTRAEWEKTVARMVGKGANLSEAEKKTLVDYLAATYKP